MTWAFMTTIECRLQANSKQREGILKDEKQYSKQQQVLITILLFCNGLLRITEWFVLRLINWIGN